MEIDVNVFKGVLQKATLNYLFETVGMTISPDIIHVGMRSTNCVVVLNMKNDMIPSIKNEEELYFSQPQQQIKTYLDLIDEDTADIKITDTKIILESGKQKSHINFCSPNLINVFNGNGPKQSGDIIYEKNLDDDWMYMFEKIQRIASKFKCLYFTIEDGMIFMEGTDKTNAFSNGMSIELEESGYDQDVQLCFDLKTFSNIVKVIGTNHEDFTVTVSYIPDRKAGIVSFINNDESEKYYIVSRSDGE